MRKLAILTSVLAIALVASVSQAATMSFGVKAGMAIPAGDLTDILDPGFSGGVYGDLWITPRMAFGADIAGDFLTSEVNDALEGTIERKYDIIQYGAHGIVALAGEGSSFAPAIQYGVAMYNGTLKRESSFATYENSGTDLGLNGGLNLDFMSGSTMRFGIGGEYHYILTEDEPTSLIRILARLTFLTTPPTR